jgi:hypothetical protein
VTQIDLNLQASGKSKFALQLWAFFIQLSLCLSITALWPILATGNPLK